MHSIWCMILYCRPTGTQVCERYHRTGNNELPGAAGQWRIDNLEWLLEVVAVQYNQRLRYLLSRLD
jgi:hypothetical protein